MREDNIAIFQDTECLYNTNIVLKNATKNSISNQKVILETDALDSPKENRYAEPAEIIISKKRTFEAASEYKAYKKVAVHNFASASNPGGGVVNGASAQEECLCRCSNLYACLNQSYLWKKFYEPHRKARNPLHNADIIYTPEVWVYKTDTANPKLMEEKDWYQVDVITCAAPNLRERKNDFGTMNFNKTLKISDSELYKIHVLRLRKILDVALQNDVEVIILGAFGCGAFANNPRVVAKAAKDIVMEYQYQFKKIEFAIYCNQYHMENYDAFQRAFR